LHVSAFQLKYHRRKVPFSVCESRHVSSAYQPSVYNQNGIPVGFFTSHRRSGGYPPTSSSFATAPTHSPAWITPQFIRSICYHHKQATGGCKKVSLGTDVSCEVSEKKEHTDSRNNAKSDTSIGGRGFNESGEEQQVGTFSSLSPASSENVDSVISASTASPGLF
uniref:Pecanex-like protein n=1 Tax=Toxocara canis TaxID=6265 RepID=A0A183U645_TOXCA